MGACCIHFLRGCDNQFVVVLHANCQGLERVVARLTMALVHDFAKHFLAEQLLHDALVALHLMETLFLTPCALCFRVVGIAATWTNHAMTATADAAVVHFAKVWAAV